MSANPALTLLAVDPGLAHVGLVVVSITQMHQLEIRDWVSIDTDPKATDLERYADVGNSVLQFVEELDERLDYVVIEDPTWHVQSDAKGKAKDPRTINRLCAAYGVIVSVLQTAADSPALRGGLDRVRSVAVANWYPRSGRGKAGHNVVLAQVRDRYPVLKRASEHVCFALALADWWSATAAPVIWHEQRQAAAR